jgi:hypothetical protein
VVFDWQSVVLRVVSLPEVPELLLVEPVLLLVEPVLLLVEPVLLLLEPVLLLDDVLSPVCELDDDPAEPSARRIVPELCVLPVSALEPESLSEPMLWHPASPAPTSVDAMITIKYLLFMSHLVLLPP